MKQLPPSFILCPIFDDVNKWNFFYPPPSQIGKCLILGNFFFLKASLIDNLGGGVGSDYSVHGDAEAAEALLHDKTRAGP